MSEAIFRCVIFCINRFGMRNQKAGDSRSACPQTLQSHTPSNLQRQNYFFIYLTFGIYEPGSMEKQLISRKETFYKIQNYTRAILMVIVSAVCLSQVKQAFFFFLPFFCFFVIFCALIVPFLLECEDPVYFDDTSVLWGSEGYPQSVAYASLKTIFTHRTLGATLCQLTWYDESGEKTRLRFLYSKVPHH